ncbi:hypothetical protein E6H33_07055 [Candidatus Bathyarchaeota archaeon]|nr:MAG: hypothetical protein E6H33_07055 [Candidatus Bathyarchaeota archaeon]
MDTRNFRLAAGTSYILFLLYVAAARFVSVSTAQTADFVYWFPIAFIFLLVVPSLVLIAAEIGQWISRRKQAKRKPPVSWQEGLRT